MVEAPIPYTRAEQEATPQAERIDGNLEKAERVAYNTFLVFKTAVEEDRHVYKSNLHNTLAVMHKICEYTVEEIKAEPNIDNDDLDTVKRYEMIIKNYLSDLGKASL